MEPPTTGIGAVELLAEAAAATDDPIGAETTGGADETAGAEVTAEAADSTGTVTKTPPGRPGVEMATGADVTTGATPTVVAGAVPTVAWQEPIGVESAFEVARPSLSSESPGFGKMTSAVSAVVQPFSMLATNISGREL